VGVSSEPLLLGAHRRAAHGGVVPGSLVAAQFVGVGDEITVETEFLRGHGTTLRDGVLVATIAGFVERVNKLVSVRPLSARYQGEVGDVVVGRVSGVGDKRWFVDVNSRQLAALLLSSVNIYGGVQRRRTEEDSLLMRTFFSENDFISAEIQSVQSDGGIALHTRSLKYGKLRQGLFVAVPAALIKRSSQHFHSLPCGVDIILGVNGYVWIAPTPPPREEPESTENKEVVADESTAEFVVSVEQRDRVARVRNCVLALARSFLPIHVATVMDAYDSSVSLGLTTRDVLHPDHVTRVTERAAGRS
jgi:exosome complex component RRP4